MAQTKASLIDLNSNELILDLDGDTTLHSSTDDQIDIKIAGADDFTFTAGAFNILASSHAVFADSSEAKFGAGTDLQIYHDGTNSFIANKTGALKIATETSGIAITIGHTTSEVTVADNLTVTGNANIGGTLTFADGSIALADLDIDGATDIGAAIVDADLFIIDDGAGGTNRKVAASRIKTYIGSTTAVDDLTLGDAAVTIATSSGNITIDAQAGDTDIIFKGTDSSADITALTLDMSDAGTAVFNHDIRIADDGQIGSASDADAIVINSSGVVTMNQIPVFSAGLNVSGGTIAGTLSTAAQGNITSLGTLTALTVDDVAIDGKVITMTGSSSDTAVITAGTNGTLSIVTTDDAAAAANIQITADGTFEVDATTITLDSAGDVALDAGGGNIKFVNAGTEFARISPSSSDVIIEAKVQDKDLLFKGDDGGSVITALTLDMSAAGKATFNDQVVIGDGKLVLNSTAVTSTAAELNLLDGVSGLVQADLTKLAAVDATASELNITQGSNSATSTTVADADRVVMNDNGTMVQVAVTDLAAYFDDEITAMPNLITVGATGTATSVAGIPFFSDISNNSIYTHDVSGTDDTAEGNTAFGVGALDAITTGDYNTAVGFGALSAHQTGEGNVAIGQAALNANTDSNNLAVGKSALLVNTSGTRNIAIGNRANDLADTENDNLAIGYQAMTAQVAGGEYNVAIGNYSLDALTSGDYNTVMGYGSGSALTTGVRNVIIGSAAADAMETGSSNVIIGDEAVGGGAFTSSKLVAIGRNAGFDLIAGDNTTLVGYEAGTNLTTGDSNIAIGANSLDNCDTESNNLAIGVDSMHGSINGGEYNLAIGNNTLDALTSADYVTAVGYNAGSSITTGGYNTFIGYGSGDAATDLDGNVGVGHDTLGSNVHGDRNTAVGYGALRTHTVASKADVGNTAVGWAAGAELTTGDGNTLIGHQAYATGSGNLTTGSSNVAIGMDLTLNTNSHSNSICLGAGIEGYTNRFSFGKASNVVENTFTSDANWSRSSDERLKTNITDVSWKALDFINELRPITFNWKASQDISDTMIEHDADKNNMDTTTVIDGLVAQEVKAAMDKHDMDNFSGWKERSNRLDKEKTQQISKEAFVIPLIKAMQELSTKVDALTARVTTLEG